MTQPNKDDKPFDHDDHLRRLTEAELELRVTLNRADLAGAVNREIALYNDFMTRLGGARSAQRQVRILRDNLDGVLRDLEQYVTHNKLPWILPKGTMFGEEEPRG